MPEPKNESFEALLQYLKNSHGFDFTGYKRTTLQRRAAVRMRTIGVEGFEEYRNYLEVHPKEFVRLFNTILINVTAFFRDPQAWESLARNYLPGMLKQKQPGQPIRVWSAGCASGEEAITIAMLLAEALGPADFVQRVRIYATDIDDDALTRARQSVYSRKDLETVPAELAARYFEPAGDSFRFRADLRRAISFGHRDLLADAPISRLDLLICRNTLMYMNSDTQQGIIRRFHHAVVDTGLLFLGRAEMLMTRGGLFLPADFKHRIFTTAAAQSVEPGAIAPTLSGRASAVNPMEHS